MQDIDFDPEFYALPMGPSGLPDLLIFSRKQLSDSSAIVTAFIVTPLSPGYWCEEVYVESENSMEWALVYAKEKVRQYVVEQRPTEQTCPEDPFQLRPFEDWRAFAAQVELGFYPGFRPASRNNVKLGTKTREVLKAPEVHIAEKHYRP